MRFNPYIHAIGASAYIFGLVSLIGHIASLHHDTPDTIVGTMAAMSLFTFSAAVMAFLFFYRPVALLIEGKKREAMIFFLKTVGTFGLLTLVVVATLL